MKTIKIIDTISSEFAVSPEDGDLVFSKIEECIKKRLVHCWRQ